MSRGTQPHPGDLPESSGGTEVFSDGANRIISTSLNVGEFLAHEDQRMNKLIKLYFNHCRDGNIPDAADITPEKIFSTGMMSRTHCLRVESSAGSLRYAVWAQDANFDGYRSLQNMEIDDGAPFPILTRTVQKQLESVLSLRAAAFFEVRGLINDHYYYFTKAILPLRNEEGEIVKCFVPFTDKLPDIPPDLREEFCTRGVEKEN